MNKSVPSQHLETGRAGEEIACRFLMKHGWRIVDRNYRKKWGEIDIVAKSKTALHFVEVKTLLEKDHSDSDRHRPEDHMSSQKLKRLDRAIQSYLAEKRIPSTINWQLDLVAILINREHRKAKVTFLEKVHL